MSDKSVQNGTKKLAVKLGFAVVGMFAFGFALVPLYDVICDITGLNGKTGERVEAVQAGMLVDEQREVTIQFTTRQNDVDGVFKAEVPQMTLKPGEMKLTSYRVSNPSDEVRVVQAIPSVAPNAAALHLNKVECFCFQEQILEPGQTVDMPLRFFIDPKIPEQISKLTLSYTLYDITEKHQQAANKIASR
ncbi:cytochrome c oxidase assembly protein [Pseudohongiella nitratireducens]|jgi:cytochrome c oxidase assembly protein subunit 11|uniref:Cytochrome c oxidase assembly protein CtaG n=1 Tax=Pseudohongiella nitratireducens TaxID=1768907 RepID=A0A917GW51_9GAMM|nr:cytochrome c oxidase assembly protein [Pseudohongiella nitratireducens]MDF1623961.1 cytochrome c oxidase assembly protein [Pseudohongiella nitratireducens]GGG59171.1 cytochrome c oxidase assembly protein [Pseudohongiella nitratireducens]|tara:strand:- start:2769 stop:3338 length:570 start_codon:yes stop_codon:yes gene_type:complete